MFRDFVVRVRFSLIAMSLLAVLLVPLHGAGAQEPVMCDGVIATIVGTEGRDLLLGTAGRDVMAGLGGNDVLRGFGGDDLMCGDDGRDRLFGGLGSDTIFGGRNNDILKGDAGPDLLFGNQGRDRLVGGGGNDYLEGGSGLRDSLRGKGGVDTCVDRQPTTTTDTCEEVGAPRPPTGQALDVVAVAASDVLNFRNRPDPSATIVATAPPETETNPSPPTIISTGVGQNFGNEVWWQVTIADESAWANSRFLGMLGVSVNVFSELEADMTSLSAPTIDELADAMGATRSDGPTPRVVVVDLINEDAVRSQAWVDVMGIGDDAVKGERIHLILLNIVDHNAPDFVILGYEIGDATRTVICGRGITVDDLCV